MTVLFFVTVCSNLYQWHIPGALGHPVGELPGDIGLDNHCLHLLFGRPCRGSHYRTHDNTLWKVKNMIPYLATVCKSTNVQVQKISSWDFHGNMQKVSNLPVDKHLHKWIKIVHLQKTLYACIGPCKIWWVVFLSCYTHKVCIKQW